MFLKTYSIQIGIQFILNMRIWVRISKSSAAKCEVRDRVQHSPWVVCMLQKRKRKHGAIDLLGELQRTQDTKC